MRGWRGPDHVGSRGLWAGLGDFHKIMGCGSVEDSCSILVYVLPKQA